MAGKRNFAVIGLGAYGVKICEVLSEKGVSVIAMDRESAALESIKDVVSAAVSVDTTDEEALLKAPLEDVDVAIVAIGDNKEASILTTALLKQRGIPYVVARSVSDLHGTVLRRVGANEVLNVEEEMGARVARRLVAPDVLDSIPLSENVSLTEILIPPYFVGKTPGELDLEGKMKCVLTAVNRTEMDVDDSGNTVRRETLLFPKADTRLEEGDKLYLLGRNMDLDDFREL